MLLPVDKEESLLYTVCCDGGGIIGLPVIIAVLGEDMGGVGERVCCGDVISSPGFCGVIPIKEYISFSINNTVSSDSL